VSTLADPRCPLCKGAGHIFEDSDSIVPIAGRTCDCVLRKVRSERITEHLTGAELPERYRDASFDHFSLIAAGEVMVKDKERGTLIRRRQADIDRENLDRARGLAGKALRDETIVFTGPFGVGKTYLACALLIAQIRGHDKSGLYITSYDYIRTLMPDAAPASEQQAQRAKARRVDILLLDDLGVEKGSPFAMRELWDLLHERTANGRATIITSNLSIGEALQATKETKGLTPDEREAHDIGRRIFSRLAELRVAPIQWPEGTADHRMTVGTARATGRTARISVRAELEAIEEDED
jgi:DNA replication protein DnaC